MVIEEIKLNDFEIVYRCNGFVPHNQQIISEYIDKILNEKETIDDAYFYSTNSKEHGQLDEILNQGKNLCLTISNNDEKYKIISESWVNILKSNNPKQPKLQLENYGEILFHNHLGESSFFNRMWIPELTFIYYIQMPNNLTKNDGCLLIKDSYDNIHSILPKENEFIIMSSHILHRPMTAYNSTKDRIAFVSNIKFELQKTEKTFL